MISKEKAQHLSLSYHKARAKEEIVECNETTDLFLGLEGLYRPLYLSADEVVLNKLDEDMSPQEYLDYGEEPIIEQMLQHYKTHGIFVDEDVRGAKNLIIPSDTPKFNFPKKNTAPFSQEDRRYILNLMHELLEKNTLTQTMFLERLGIHQEKPTQ